MKNNKKKLITVLTISIALVGVVVLAFNNGLISKLKSSVLDPVTGDVCTEDAEASNIIHENGDSVKAILDDLYAAKDSTCSVGYSCDKPTIPTQVEPDSCFTLSTNHIIYSIGGEQLTVENAIKELYRIYNTPDFCPQKYCKPNTYTVHLDKNGGTSQGTSKIYEKFDTAVYLDSTENNKMTASANPITKPQKVYTITYEANGQGASYTGSPTTSSATFNGYFTKTSGGTKMIDENGYIIPSNFPNNKYSNEATLYAQYSNTAIKLPAITKANATCKWAEGSASGTQYAGGTSRTISGNTKYYAVCVANPIITVINNKCDENGNNCTQASKVTYQKASGTTETISATAQSGYNNPGSYSVTYNANHTLTFNHTKIISLSYARKYSSSQIRALHTGDHTDIHVSDTTRAYMATEAATLGTDYQYFDYTRYSSSTFDRFPYLFPLPDSKYSGANYSNGVRGTFYIRTCSTPDSSSCTDAEELRPYFEIRYDLRGGSGKSDNQSKFAGQSITLHGTPTRSGYTFKGWTATTQGGEQCILCNGTCGGNSYYAADTKLDGQDWNVGNESWPCPTKEAYVGGTNIVWLRAVWNRNAWITYN